VELTACIDRIADDLEARGLLREAYELDVLANTLDLMTAPAPVTQRERMEEFNYAVLDARKNPTKALQDFKEYWGPDWGKSLFEIAKGQATAGRTLDLFPQWQKATQQAKHSKTTQQQSESAKAQKEDPFMSPAERAQLKKPAPKQQDDVFINP
jgi:hypothetical protein